MTVNLARAIKRTLYAAQPVRLPAVPTRVQIERLEEEMRKFPPLVIEPVHHFSKGLYAREILIPKGTLLTGRVHKAEHLNFVSQGDITVWTEDGMKRIKAPACIASRPGTKRVGYAHEDTVWTTVHATENTDLEAIEAELIEPERTLAIEGTALLIAQEIGA